MHDSKIIRFDQGDLPGMKNRRATDRLGGVFAVARRVWFNPVANKDHYRFKLWVWMISEARFKDGVTLKRGQLFASMKDMAEVLKYRFAKGWKYPSRSMIQRILEDFKTAKMISTERNRRGLLVTILNYEKYQAGTPSMVPEGFCGRLAGHHKSSLAGHHNSTSKTSNNNGLSPSYETLAGHQKNSFVNDRRVITSHKKECNNKNEVKEKSTASSDAAPKKKNPAAEKRSDCPVDEIHEVYLSTCSDMPRSKLTPTLRTNIRARWKELAERRNLGWWVWYFDYCHKSDFLSGRVKAWRADLHWLCGPENMTKVLSGRYVNRDSVPPPRPTTYAQCQDLEARQRVRWYLENQQRGGGNENQIEAGDDCGPVRQGVGDDGATPVE